MIRQITIDTATANPGRFDYRAGVVPSLDLGTFNVTDIANYRPATNGVRPNRVIAGMDEKVAKLCARRRQFDEGLVLGVSPAYPFAIV